MMLSFFSNRAQLGVWRAHFLRHSIALGLLSMLAVALFLFRLDERALWSSHEGRAGQHAQLMIDTQRWGMPVLFFGESDYQKPPLYYWLVASLAKLRGGRVDAWSVRFPAAAAAAAGLWLVYAAGVRFGHTWMGVFAALIVACNLRYSWLARVGRIDMPLMLAVTSVLVCFYTAYRYVPSCVSQSPKRGAWKWLAGAYSSASVAVMLKGPIGLVLPSVPILLFLAWQRELAWPWRREFRELLHRYGAWWGIPLILASAGPWYVWASIVTHGAFFETFFVHHNWDRTWGVEGLKPEPVWYYVPQIFADMFPWSVLIPAALCFELRRGDKDDRTFGRFTLCWVLGIFALLSVVRFKRHDYLLPVLPGLALLLARQWERLFMAVRTRRDARWSLLFAVVLCVMGCSVVGSLAISRLGSVRSLLQIPIMHGMLHSKDQMLLSEFQAILSQSSARLLGIGLCVGVVLIMASWQVYARRPVAAAIAIAAAWLLTFMTYVCDVLPPLESLREQRTIAELARQLRPSESPLYYYGREDQQLMFYLGPNARWLPNRTALWPVITQTEPALVIMELQRFESRLKDWPGVPMVPISRNTENSLGTHQNPAVLVTNEGGWRLLQARPAASDVRAN